MHAEFKWMLCYTGLEIPMQLNWLNDQNHSAINICYWKHHGLLATQFHQKYINVCIYSCLSWSCSRHLFAIIICSNSKHLPLAKMPGKRILSDLHMIFSIVFLLWVELPVAAANDKYVFRMARCCCVMSSNSALLKLGQNIHRKIVPTIANKSDV